MCMPMYVFFLWDKFEGKRIISQVHTTGWLHEKDNASASKNALGRRIRLLTTVKMTIDYAAFCTVLLETYHGKGTSTY